MSHIPQTRIGYLLRMYPRFSQTFVVNEILELERQGLDLSIVSLRTPNEGVFHGSVARVKARARYLPDRVLGHGRKHLAAQWRLFRRSPGAYARAVKAILRHEGAGWFELLQAAHLLRWAKKENIRHIHVHFGTDEATVALLAHLLGGLSYSLTLHAFDIFRDNVDQRLLAAKINHSRFTVTVCDSNRRYAVDHLPGVDAAKIRVNYNGIDLSRFTVGTDAREERSIFGVGRLIEKKGFVHLVRAVALLRDDGLEVTCRIAGDGREERALVKEIKRLGLSSQVQLLGSLCQDRIEELMQRSAGFVLPCVRAKDGNVDALPTVLLEALACGCPTISTRLSGVPEIIEDGVSGLLVEPGDPEALAAAIRKVLVDRRLAGSLAGAGRRRAEARFDVTQKVATMARWLGEAAVPSDAPAEAAPSAERASPVYEAA